MPLDSLAVGGPNKNCSPAATMSDNDIVGLVCAHFSKNLAVVKLAKQLFVRWPVFRNRPADPRHVHVVFERDVFVGAVAAPESAAHAGGHRHAIGEGSRVGTALYLADHHAAHRGGER